MNGDGSNDIVLRHNFDQVREVNVLRIACVDGRSGIEHWESELGQTLSSRDGFQGKRDPIFIADSNDDGNPDVLCQRVGANGPESTVALNGRSGELLWEQPIIEEKSYSLGTFFGRSTVLPTLPNKPKLFVVAKSIDRDNVRVDFHDLEDGRRVSSWEGAGRFKSFSFNLSEGDPLSPRNGVPFAVNAGEECYAGVCIEDKKTKKLQLVVFEPRDADATVVQRIDIPKLDHHHSFASGVVVIVDANDDGRTDVVFHDGSDLVAVDLVDNKEINRKPMPAGLPRLSTVEFDSSLLQLTSEGTINRDGEYDQIKFIDLKTFEVVWDLHSPPGALVNGLLSAGKPDVSNLNSTLPRVWYRTMPNYQRVVASEDDFLGDDEQVRQQISQTAATAVRIFSSHFP